MAKGLIIVESPAKASTISKFLDNKYIVKASMGHIRDLPKNELGVNIEDDFAPKYTLDKTKTKLVGELKEAVKKVEAIYLASDHDREGEAIAWHLSKVLEKELEGKKLHRIIFNEITAKAIRESLDHPEAIDQNKVDAQQARRILDRIVGYQVSPILWKIIAKDLSAGRVQSVALRLICEREEEITAFVPKEFWKLEADFWRDTLPKFKAVLDKWQGKKAELEKESDALSIIASIKDKPANIKDIKRSEKESAPPAPFITSTLQQEASKILNMQAQKTMAVAQQLYEGMDIGGEHTGLITYMRTDSFRIADEATENCRKLISERYGKSELNTSVRSFKNKNSAQDAHEAIRPTDAFRTPESLSSVLNKEQLKLYTLIWQRFVATQMKPVKLLNTSVQIAMGDAIFAASGNQITSEGFLKAYPHVNFPPGEKIDKAYSASDLLEHTELINSQHFTTPPSRYTEASLIKELEAKGIGRPSTYASILSTIRQRKYVSLEKKSFLPTSLGMSVFRFLVERFNDIFNVKFTASMEDKLDEIETKDIIWHSLVKDYYTQLQALIGKVDIKKEKESFKEETDILCDLCKSAKMMIKRNRSGEFLACSAFPKCRNSKSFIRDENGKIQIKEKVTLSEACPKCGNPLVERSGKFGEFIACSTYPKCKFSKPKSSGVKCPDCGKGEVVERRNKKGRLFYSCSTYPECKWISNDKPIAMTCPVCQHHMLFEKYQKGGALIKVCPKCKTQME